MVHLIDKDALVAEIDRQRDEALKRQQNLESIGQETVFNEMLANKLNSILSFLNTLEVKEVDFGTEVYKYIGEHFKVYDDGNQTLQNKDKNALIGRVDAENIAKYFFELGLKAKQG